LTMKTADRPVAGPRPRSPPPDWVALMCQQMFKVITSIRARYALFATTYTCTRIQ
jgi:hypothetical protein